MFRKVLVANRGEIAVRVIRACRELHIPVAAIFSEADADALHVRLADEAHPCGPAAARDSYLRVDRIVEIARSAGADALHPGYGFLSENGDLAEACEKAGITFIGPSAAVIRRMGDKLEARRLLRGVGIPIVPGGLDPVSDAEAPAEAGRLGYPVMLKARAGGGGRGLRLVRDEKELAWALPRARSEARSAFGDDGLYLEKLVDAPRHVEIQVLADQRGEVVHLFERECSIQRRHQKLVEEAPSPRLGAALRDRMGEAAVAAARAVGYRGAGTCEFLVDAAGDFHFLEMNTRIQVEHAITEEITGVDLVKAQIRIAAGEPLWLRQEELAPRGHAIEVRIYAEDPDKGFLPSAGEIAVWRPPDGPGVRVDSGVEVGSRITPYYDAMVAKLVVWGWSREEALARLRRALEEFAVAGIRTTLPFHRRAVDDAAFREGVYDTGFVARLLHEPAPAPDAELVLAARALTLLEASLDAAWLRDGGERRRVSLARLGDGRHRLVTDGEGLDLELARSGSGLWSIRVGARQLEAAVQRRGSDAFDVSVAGVVLRLRVEEDGAAE